MTPPRTPLTDENRRQHEVHEEVRLDFLEALTELDLPRARADFEALRAGIRAHMELEESFVLPAFVRVLGAADDPRGATVEHVEGDHKILRKTFERCAALLTALEGERAGLRRTLVRELDTFLLLGRVLEHHSAREERFVYPVLDEALSEAEQTELFERMRSLPLHPP